jgi:hypothetical protein
MYLTRPTTTVDTLTFASKIDGWLWVVLVGSALACFAAAAAVLVTENARGLPIAAAIVILGCALPVWLLASTRYTLTSSELQAHSGPFRWHIALDEIRTVTPTRNPLSSPALSLDRLRIEYGRERSIMISPRDKETFLRELDARRSASGV